jgi:hypothetical protein
MTTGTIVAAQRPESEPTISLLKTAWRRFGTPLLVCADGDSDRAHDHGELERMGGWTHRAGDERCIRQEGSHTSEHEGCRTRS